MNTRKSFFTALVWLAVLPAAQAQQAPIGAQPPPTHKPTPLQPPLLLRTDFTKDAEGWTTFGEGGKATTALDTVTGKGTLKFEYEIKKGGMTALILPISDNEITRAQSFRFSVKAEQTTTMVMGIQEQDGGRYLALIHAPGGKWQDVALGKTDFILSEGPGDPKDPDGKLDLDHIQAMVIGDLAVFLAQSDEPVLKLLFNIKPGPRSFTLSEFTASAAPLAAASYFSRSDPRLDTFLEPQIGWLAIGGTDLSPVNDKPLAGHGIKVSYKQEAGKIGGAARPFPKGRFAEKEKLVLNIGSDHAATLIVQVEEVGGGKYNTVLNLEGPKAGETTVVRDYSLLFSSFKPSDDSKDTNGKLDLDQVHQILILDGSGMLGSATGTDNILWIGGLRAMAAGQ